MQGSEATPPLVQQLQVPSPQTHLTAYANPMFSCPDDDHSEELVRSSLGKAWCSLHCHLGRELAWAGTCAEPDPDPACGPAAADVHALDAWYRIFHHLSLMVSCRWSPRVWRHPHGQSTSTHPSAAGAPAGAGPWLSCMHLQQRPIIHNWHAARAPSRLTLPWREKHISS